MTAKRRKHLSDAGTGVFEREASRIARALAPIGTIDISDPSGWNLALTQPEEDAAGSALAGWDGAENFICFSPGTKQPINNWPDPQWISVLETVSAAHPDLGAAVIGASDDRERGSTLLNAWRGPTLNCCGEISPRASAALMQRARLFLGHDSGPMHLAAAVQTPVVAVFSRRNPPGIWFPFGDDHRIFYPGLAWSGGHPAVTRTADGETDIASIPAEQVAAACCVNLAQAGRPAA